MLLNSDEDLNIFKDDISNIFKYAFQPIFIAHNGKRFDFPILEYHNIINKTNDYKKIDTLYLFRLYTNEKVKSNKLIDLYNFICKKDIIQVHRAKEDAMLIVDMFRTLQYTKSDFIKND
jgi:uncharacterized protein YprB with RNaseH-like and TPR domain